MSFYLTRLKYNAGDTNKSVIMLWNNAKKGWYPSTDDTTYQTFMELKNYGFSDHYFQLFKNNTLNNIGQLVKNVSFSNGSYTQFSTLKNYVIYCDPPPHQEHSQYYDGEHIKNLCFDHVEFYKWCRDMSNHNIVFLSEYNSPNDFEKIYSINTEKDNSNRIDNLYIV